MEARRERDDYGLSMGWASYSHTKTQQMYDKLMCGQDEDGEKEISEDLCQRPSTWGAIMVDLCYPMSD